MSDARYPKKLLFGWLPQKHPVHGAKLCWRDEVYQDLKKSRINESLWCTEVQDRTRWRSLCRDGLDRHLMVPPPDKPFDVTSAIGHSGESRISLDTSVPLPILGNEREKSDHFTCFLAGLYHLQMTSFKFFKRVCMDVCSCVCVCVCLWMSACAYLCVCVCACVCVHVCVQMCVQHVCMFLYNVCVCL